jgi:hypothetical protein
VVAAVAGIVLVLLVLLQGPKLLNAVTGSDEEAAALPAPVTPPATTSKPRPSLLLRGASVDPFASKRMADGDPQMASVAAPPGTRDPFRKASVAAPKPEPAPQPAAPAPLPQQIVVGTPTRPGAVAKHGWIVVLASVRTSAGRGTATREAAEARGRGLKVSILNSSTRKPLRAGYYVVYTGPYPSLSAVQRAAGRAHSSGYRTAYVREILRYGP